MMVDGRADSGSSGRDPRQHLGVVPDELPGLVRLRGPGAPKWEREGMILLKPDDFGDEALKLLAGAARRATRFAG